MNALRTVTVMGGDRRPGERMPALSEVLKPQPLPELVIDDNVPPPLNTKGVRSKARIALEQLRPGQSVVIPPQMHSASAVRLMARAVRKAHPERAFTSKSERGGIRVWRIE